MTLELSDSAASQCASACDRFTDELAVLVKMIADSSWAAGFGTLPSGIALARKYSDLTHGPEGSLSSVLAAHITAVTNLREAFLEAGRGYQETEDDSTSRIANTGPR